MEELKKAVTQTILPFQFLHSQFFHDLMAHLSTSAGSGYSKVLPS
jgi:hypothetical protein